MSKQSQNEGGLRSNPDSTSAPCNLNDTLNSLFYASRNLFVWAEIINRMPLEEITNIGIKEPDNLNKTLYKLDRAINLVVRMQSAIEASRDKLLEAAKTQGNA